MQSDKMGIFTESVCRVCGGFNGMYIPCKKERADCPEHAEEKSMPKYQVPNVVDIRYTRSEGGELIHLHHVHSVLFPDGARWDAINGITDVGDRQTVEDFVAEQRAILPAGLHEWCVKHNGKHTTWVKGTHQEFDVTKNRLIIYAGAAVVAAFQNVDAFWLEKYNGTDNRHI
jgi:hypothetical protein